MFDQCLQLAEYSVKMTSITSTAKEVVTLRTLRTTLRSFLNMFEDICGFADKLSNVTSVSQVMVRLEKLDELWEKVNDVILNIEIHEDTIEDEEIYFKKQSKFSNRYYEVKSLLLDKVKELKAPLASNPSAV